VASQGFPGLEGGLQLTETGEEGGPLHLDPRRLPRWGNAERQIEAGEGLGSPTVASMEAGQGEEVAGS
jgi:hypothetical protein